MMNNNNNDNANVVNTIQRFFRNTGIFRTVGDTSDSGQHQHPRRCQRSTEVEDK